MATKKNVIKKKSIALHAFQNHCNGLIAKMHGITKKTTLEEFCAVSNNIRTSFFMMEALCRMYIEVHGEKPFVKWLTKCKRVEDVLGELDFYNNEILPQTTASEEKERLQKKIREIYVNAMGILQEDKWLNGKRIQKMEVKITSLTFEKENEKVKKFLQQEIDKIVAFHTSASYTHFEEEIHEMRRKIRWISIYAQSLNGFIQLKKGRSNTKRYQKYLTKEVLESKFNVLPLSTHGVQNLFFNQNAFYAMSWIISELGKIKDEGLVLMYKKDTSKIEELSQKVKEMCTVFIEKDEVLQNLIVS